MTSQQPSDQSTNAGRPADSGLDDDRHVYAGGKGDVDPPADTEPSDESAAPAERGTQLAAHHPEIQQAVETLIHRVSGEAGSALDRRLIRETLTAVLKLIPDGRHTGELKLISAAIKELRYAYRVFGQYPDPHKVTIFGSARTPKGHPDYSAAVEFSRIMAEKHWMVITGAGGGIMEAGHEGPGREASFGVAIRLPFEQTTNEIIRGDQKLINFRYFFTRKLMFVSQAEAVVCFPGGFGTLDEAFETLTLIQTGKAAMIPVVFVDGEDNGERHSYWNALIDFFKRQLEDRGMISPEDHDLYYLASGPRDAADHILRFYRNYHSCRYVGNDLIIRTLSPLPSEAIDQLNDEFAALIEEGRIDVREPHEAETEALELPRIGFTHNRRHFGLLRRLIDRVNEFGSEAEAGR